MHRGAHNNARFICAAIIYIMMYNLVVKAKNAGLYRYASTNILRLGTGGDNSFLSYHGFFDRFLMPTAAPRARKQQPMAMNETLLLNHADKIHITPASKRSIAERWALSFSFTTCHPLVMQVLIHHSFSPINDSPTILLHKNLTRTINRFRSFFFS